MPLDLRTELAFLQRHGHDFAGHYSALEMRLLCILSACRPGDMASSSQRELRGPLQHFALVHAIVEHFGGGDSYRVTTHPERLAELTGIPEHTVVTVLLPALKDLAYV